MFLKRSYSPEMIDDFSITDKRITSALKELKIINYFLGGVSATKKGLSFFNNNKKETYRILDAGSGDSNTLTGFKKSNFELISLDKNSGICKYMMNNKQDAKVICGDAMHIPIKSKSINIVHASLFLHHFNEEQINLILSEFLRTCREGIVINDLRRSVSALAGIKILTRLFSNSEMIKHDGPLSVKRGFVKKELINILEKFNVKYIIKRKWAFRWLIIILT